MQPTKPLETVKYIELAATKSTPKKNSISKSKKELEEKKESNSITVVSERIKYLEINKDLIQWLSGLKEKRKKTESSLKRRHKEMFTN